MGAERATRTAREWTVARRAFSSTPLSRQHARLLADGGKRNIKPIPWKQFDRARYHPAALKLAGLANKALATGEYGAVTVFSRITASMVIHSIPFDFISAASRAATDELRHADYAAQFSELCTGKPVLLELDRKTLDHSPMTLPELDRLMLELAAIGEAFACGLISACFELATDPVARAYFGNLIKDEVHHARLGFHYLEWRAPQWTLEEKQALSNHAGVLVRECETRFCRGRDASPEAKADADALGVLDSRAQIEAAVTITGEQIVPALDQMGFGASHAFRARFTSRARRENDGPSTARRENDGPSTARRS